MTKILLLIVTLFITGYCSQRVMSEYYWTKFSKTGEVKHLENLLLVDDRNTIANIYMALATQKDPVRNKIFIDRALHYFNGDVVLWSVYMQKGQSEASVGNVRGAKDSFDKSLYYWPKFDDARKASDQMKEILNSGTPIMIQFGDKK